MRILIINSVYGFGSTGRICRDIALSAQKNGDECMIGCRESHENTDDSPKIVVIGSRTNILLHGLKSRLMDNHGLNSKLATRKFLAQAEAFNPDLLWLHNIHGYYINYELLFEWIKSRPSMIVKWTLHDCWAFTGHCAYFEMVGCDKWQSMCEKCPQIHEYPKSILFDNSSVNYQRKKNAFSGIQNLTLICPSMWLANLVKFSFLSQYPVSVCYNNIDEKIFKPTASDYMNCNNMSDKKMVLGVSNVWSYRKGLDRYIELASMLPENYIMILVGKMTKKQRSLLPTNIVAYGQTSNPEELASLYTEADCFVCLTREDNYPTVNLESEACGTRVITLDVGGCRETIKRSDSKVVSSLEDVYDELMRRS